MNDDLGLFADNNADSDAESDDAGRGRDTADANRGARGLFTRWRRNRPVLLAVGLVVLLVVGGGAWYGAQQLLGIGDYADYPGNGDSEVVVQVKDGDSVGQIASRLKEKDVVASARAFVVASDADKRVLAIQPGYYIMKTKMSGASAVTRIVKPEVKVGTLEIKGGYQLHDITQPDGTVKEGVLSLLAKATCAELNGKSTCIPVEQIRQAAETADLDALGVPDWAKTDVANAEPKNRLEGLIVRGVYSVEPGASAENVIKSVITASVAKLQAAGLPKGADATGFRPYEVLIVASLAEKEGIEKDFGKVARVVYNRLAKPMSLGLDSTINYELERPTLLTNDQDRERSGPYNTYDLQGLPPTPIGSPSDQAVKAAIQPEDGTWLFFVKCDKDGTSCFADTYDQHNENRHLAEQRGAY
ncbi:endolytic transglycosylase MltG [Goodfellowiella coeruleoviolacea]|uniref:Endolytic murein transglycosylase n=1 Tax=Goodfellowiella coeruleoviolacea TaxID=334858 RepID=A0AAE3GEH1_9PSEU|nr:endolytic transglycosylase MltG [Goodfellowiella coeruleoviolacea]MCP2166660.1 UPF0755 protein [Goodfellowiella coeruleoviolacea]